VLEQQLELKLKKRKIALVEVAVQFRKYAALEELRYPPISLADWHRMLIRIIRPYPSNGPPAGQFPPTPFFVRTGS
jgi:hypothetical protein